MEMVVGVISDTHGLLRDSVREELEKCDLILHAGDIGNAEILRELSAISRTVAVRGNVDRDYLMRDLKKTEYLQLESKSIYVLHNIDELDLDPAAAGINAVVYGHSHRPSITRRDHVLFLNPGSCGPKRLTLPVTMAYLKIGEKEMSAEILRLED